MARLIVKSPYIKCGGGNKPAGRYMNYIATRERVEVLEDGRPPTRKQEQLVAKLTKDFPDAKKLPEYGGYVEKPTKAIASAFITMVLESNWDAVSTSGGYAKYIATRPARSGWGVTACSATRIMWIWTRPWRSCKVIRATYGRTSSLSSVRTRSGWDTITPMRGAT